MNKTRETKGRLQPDSAPYSADDIARRFLSLPPDPAKPKPVAKAKKPAKKRAK